MRISSEQARTSFGLIINDVNKSNNKSNNKTIAENRKHNKKIRDEALSRTGTRYQWMSSRGGTTLK